MFSAPFAIFFQFNFSFNAFFVFPGPIINAFAFFTGKSQQMFLGHKIYFNRLYDSMIAQYYKVYENANGKNLLRVLLYTQIIDNLEENAI